MKNETIKIELHPCFSCIQCLDSDWSEEEGVSYICNRCSMPTEKFDSCEHHSDFENDEKAARPIIEGPTPAVRYFVNKFEMKMFFSLPSDAAWWVDGIGEINNNERRGIWFRIQDSLDRLSRDRQAEHGDMPAWIL